MLTESFELFNWHPFDSSLEIYGLRDDFTKALQSICLALLDLTKALKEFQLPADNS
jgi:hypothetical protein